MSARILPKTQSKSHRVTGTLLYRRWLTMIRRCHRPGQDNYAYYGGRGIKVCDRWRKSFASFRDDIGEPPVKGMSLERIDNDGDYEPGNVRWATAKEQAWNRRNSRPMAIEGEILPLIGWCEKFGLSRKLVTERIRRGWTSERALFAPVDCRNKRTNVLLTFNDKTMSVSKWAEYLNVSRKALYERLRLGWSIERTLTTSIGPHRRK